jgi:hypothetical protein
MEKISIEDPKVMQKVVSAMLLGDGSLERVTANSNARYRLSQSSKHRDYVDFQYEVLSTVTSVTLKEYPEYVDKRGYVNGSHYKLQTKTHPFYTKLHRQHYHMGRKTVSLHNLKQFDWLSMAIWFMDDGTNAKNSIILCSDSYNEAEQVLLQKTIWNTLNLPFDVKEVGTTKDGSIRYRLVLRPAFFDTFAEGVRPYIFDSFLYKLEREAPKRVMI